MINKINIGDFAKLENAVIQIIQITQEKILGKNLYIYYYQIKKILYDGYFSPRDMIINHLHVYDIPLIPLNDTDKVKLL